jgi:ribosomal protein L12E/L44/L45/RPP1/RPP2
MVELIKSVACCTAGGHATRASEEVVDEDEDEDEQEDKQDEDEDEERKPVTMSCIARGR